MHFKLSDADRMGAMWQRTQLPCKLPSLKPLDIKPSAAPGKDYFRKPHVKPSKLLDDMFFWFGSAVPGSSSRGHGMKGWEGNQASKTGVCKVKRLLGARVRGVCRLSRCVLTTRGSGSWMWGLCSRDNISFRVLCGFAWPMNDRANRSACCPTQKPRPR